MHVISLVWLYKDLLSLIVLLNNIISEPIKGAAWEPIVLNKFYLTQ